MFSFFRGKPKFDGTRLYNSGHITKVEELFYVNETSTMMKCECIPEMKVFDRHYKLEFDIDSTRKVTRFWCSCPSGGQGHCKHSSAFKEWINNEKTRSKTDFRNSWQEPSERAKQFYKKAKTAVELFGGRSVKNDFQPTPEKIAFQRDLMEKCKLEVCTLLAYGFPKKP